VALTPLSALAPSASRVLERLAPPPQPLDEPPPKARPWKLLVLACFGLAALSLLLPSVPTYDPWAWIIWGREITQWDLVTTNGPSWKPLPVLFTTPFALAGDDGAPALWLVVARASGLLAFAMAYRLGARLAGPWAGAIAAVALILSDEFIFNFARGNSEGMLVALVLWAVERHLDGRFDHAFLLGLAAALLRPEVWPFWGLYGLWLLLRHRDSRTAVLVFGGAAAALVLWFLPEYLGSGDWLRAASRARDPNPDSAAFADSPFVEVFVRSAAILAVPVYVGAAIAVVVAWRRRDRVPLALAAMATILMVAVALMTEGGFAGNLRYVALPAAFLCVLAGAGWVQVVRRWGAIVAVVVAAAAVPFVAADVDKLRYDWEVVEYEANFYGPNLKALIAKAGGEQRIKSCGRVFTGAFQVPSVAWRLHIHLNEAEIFPFGPGTALSMGSTPLSYDPRYPEYTKTRHWLAGSTCVRR
jgi:glycosyl transferase family 87